MSRADRPAGLNRTLIGLLGVALLVAGGLAIAAHYGRLWWVDEHSTLVPGTEAPPTWVLWAVVAGAVVLGLLCLRWLLAQLFRMPKSARWRSEGSAWPGSTVLESSTTAEPVAADVEGYEGVRSASAWVSGRRTQPRLHLLVTAEPAVDVSALRERIMSHAVARLREALEVETVAVTMELRFTEDKKVARVN
ncbi:alkaline shock response membrane anchor protein AmaP [Nocardia callitridis]|uniref:Alkaline shock response membrane anchor protein AmaP n=1 Tax=Nocardia callitridis TaxID=648753 RepID=A0ABP9KLX6_9NOCA